MAGTSTYVRPGEVVFETANVEPHELRAYEVLRAHGHSFRVLAVDPEARVRGLSSLDMEMYGSLWELKCPRGSNAKKTITRNLNKAVLQAQHASVPIERINVVLSALETSLSKDDVISIVEKKLREGKIDELVLILSEADVRYYKKGTEIPIALLSQTGGCLRWWNYSIGAELSAAQLQVAFTCVRPTRRAGRYYAVRLAGVPARRLRLPRRQEELR